MRKTLLGSLTGLLIPFAAYAAPTGYGAYQRRQPISAVSHLALTDLVRPYRPVGAGVPRIVGENELAIAAGTPTKELVIIDSAVPDKNILYRAAKPGVEIVEIDSNHSGLSQLIAILAHYKNLSALHIVSHARDGELLLGDSRITAEDIKHEIGTFSALNGALREGGDLLLYGCDLAADEAGRELLEIIHSNTHVDVAASSDKTGSQDLQGDWELEISTGDIEAKLPFSDKALKDFSAVLAAPSGAYGFQTGWTDNGYTISSTHFTVSAKDTNTLDPADVSIYLDEPPYPAYLQTDVETAFNYFYVSADGVNTGSFELTGLTCGEYDSGQFTNMRIVGILRDGGSVTSSTIYGNSGTSGQTFTFGGSQLTTFANKQLKGFKLYFDSTLGAGEVKNFEFRTFTITNAQNPLPAITSADYNAATGALVVTGTNLPAFAGASNDIVANKFTLTGEGGSTYTLTDTANVEISSGTSFTLTLSATDKAAVNLILNKNSTSSTGGTTYNLAAAEDWAAGADATAAIADSTNGVSVNNVPAPTLTSASYDASTGSLVVTGTGFLKLSGVTNDIVANKFTLTGEGGSTYTLTDTANVEISSGTSFTLTLSTTDKAGANLMLNKNGTSSTGGTTYNLAAAEDWAAGANSTVTVADSTNGVTVNNVVAPTLTSATYNANTGSLVATGTGFLKLSGATNDIVANKFTLTGEGGSTYTLTNTSNVEITSGTSFTLTLSATDKATVNLMLNKNGTSSTGGTTYNLAAAEDWAAGTDSAVTVADTSGNGVTVSNVAAPTLTSVTYDASTGSLVATGTGFLKLSGATNDIVANKFTLTGQGGSTYTLIDTANVEISSGTSFALALSATDKSAVNALLNKNGTSSIGGTTYNLAAAEDWAAGADSAVTVADLTGNGITVSNALPPPTITAPNISISGATGTVGAYKIGDTVTATWNNTAGGDNNAGITGVTVNFSQFGGGTSVTATNSSNTWTATYTIVAGSINNTTNRNVSVTATNASGPTTTTDDADATVDNIRPTVGIVVSDTALAAGETSLVTITFNEAVTGFTNADLTIANGGLSAVSSSDGGITWTATLTPTASITDATNVITLDNTGVEDAAGNAGTGTTDSNNYAIDTIRPTAGIVVTDTALAAGQTSLVTITFSEAITGLTNADLTIANGNLSAVSSSDGGITWTATLTPTAGVTDAANVITLANTGVQDAAGNTGTGTTDSNNYAIDTARPTAGIVVADTTLAVGETSLVTITFSEAITGFSNADLTVANGGLSTVSSSDGGITWTATLTPTAGITDATNVITLANTGVQDAAGNAGTGTTDSNNYAVDTGMPTVSSVSLPSNGTYVEGDNLNFTVNYGEAVTVNTTGGTPRLVLTVGALTRYADYNSGSGTGALTFRYTVPANDNDADGIALTALQTNNGTLQDAAGNDAATSLGTISSLASVLVDTQAPAVGTNAGLSVAVDASGTIGSARLAATDNISAAANITFTVIAIPANGTLLLSGGALSNGNTFTQDDINNNRVTYDHDGSATTSDSFIFTVRDAVNNLNNNSGGNFSFNFTITDENPVITAPADLDIEATGLYTTVSLRQLLGLAANASEAAVQAARLALATDVADGPDCCNPRALGLSNDRIRLQPGVHPITWRATDSEDNTAEATQTVNINPLVSFGMDQVGVEGGQVEMRIFLNGESPVYPLDVPYEVDTSASSADGGDHDLVDGTATFTTGQTEQSVTVNLTGGDAIEGDEVLVVRLGASVNAGAADSQRVTITEGNIAPTVVLSLEQSSTNTVLVTPAGGMVTVEAAFDDQNGDLPAAPFYDWSMTDAALIDTDGDVTDGIFKFDPSALNPGVYRLQVAVGDGTATTTAGLYFRVVTALPNMGVDTGDADGDGIPDYLDDIDMLNVLPGSAAQTDSYLIECEPGVLCRLGRYALLGSGGGARLTEAQLRAQDIGHDEGYEHSGGVFDFEVHGLPVAGQSVRVAIPLQTALKRGAVYRKFMNGQWSTFVEDMHNALHSAPGEAGYCPPPGDVAWQSGLRPKYNCVQLTIEDGGPNDADGAANGSIEDPGSIATPAADDDEVIVYGVRSHGGGSTDGFFLLLMTLVAVLRGTRIRKSFAGGILLLLLPVQTLAFDWDSLLAHSSLELGFYEAKGSRSSGEFSDGLAADGVDADIQTYDVSRVATQLSYIWQYRDNLSLRVGYLDLGDVTVDLTANATSDAALSASLSKHYPASAAGFVLAGRYDYPLSGQFSLSADAGIYRWNSDIALSDINGHDVSADMGNSTDPLLGLAANYRIMDRCVASLNWQRIFFDGQEVNLWGLSGIFHF